MLVFCLIMHPLTRSIFLPRNVYCRCNLDILGHYICFSTCRSPKVLPHFCFLKRIKENTISPPLSVSVTSTLADTSMSTFPSPLLPLVIPILFYTPVFKGFMSLCIDIISFVWPQPNGLCLMQLVYAFMYLNQMFLHPCHDYELNGIDTP